MERVFRRFIFLSLLIHIIIGIIGLKISIMKPDERPVLFKGKIRLTKPESIKKLQQVSLTLKDFTKEMVDTNMKQVTEKITKIRDNIGVIGVNTSKFLVSPNGKGILTKMVDPYAKDYGEDIGSVGEKGHGKAIGVFGGGGSGETGGRGASLETSLIIENKKDTIKEESSKSPPPATGRQIIGGGDGGGGSQAASYEFGMYYPQQRMLINNPQSSGGQTTVPMHSGVPPQKYVFYLQDKNTGRRYLSNESSSCQVTPISSNTYRYRFYAGNVTLTIKFQ